MTKELINAVMDHIDNDTFTDEERKHLHFVLRSHNRFQKDSLILNTLKEFECGNNVYGSAKRIRKLDDGTRNPISIITASVPITMAKNKTYSSDIDVNYHPTQKPWAGFVKPDK